VIWSEEMLENAMGYCQTCNVMLGPVKPIVLELTERQRIVSLEKLRADLQPFIDFGFRLALDDFGSGYSSYLYLAHLPVSFLKIEGWLVSHMRQDRKVAGIVESLANFARKEGMLTVAEHVEDAETARILADMVWITGRAGTLGARSWCDLELEWLVETYPETGGSHECQAPPHLLNALFVNLSPCRFTSSTATDGCPPNAASLGGHRECPVV